MLVLSPGRRRIILLLTVLPALVFLICTGFFMAWQVRGLLKHLDVILVDEVRQQTGRDVTVERVDASRLGTATVYGLRVANGKSFKSGTFLAAKKIVVRYSWVPLVYRRVPPIQSVDSIRISSPSILLERYKDGTMNIQDFLVRKPGPPRPPFMGVVRLEDARLEFRDFAAKVPGQNPAILRFNKLSGIFDGADVPQYVYSFAGRGEDGKLVDTMSVSGSLNGKKGTLSLDFKGNNAAISFWTHYIAKLGAVDIKDGRADVSMSVTRQIAKSNRRVWTFAGSADVHHATADIIGLSKPATDINGEVELTSSNFGFDVTCRADGIPIRSQGTIASFAEPKLKIKVTSKRADFSKVLGIVQAPALAGKVALSGQGPFTLDIIGPTKNLVFAVKASGATAAWNGYKADGIDIKATYAKNAIEVEQGRAKALGGQFELAGRVMLAGTGTKLALSGTALNIDIGQAPQLKLTKIRGVASGRFSVTGTTGAPQISADVQVPRGTFDKIALKGASAKVAIESNKVTIHDLSAATAGGVIHLSGDVTPSKLNLALNADRVDLAGLQKQFSIPGLGGIGSFKGTIAGPMSNPKVFGDAELFNGRLSDYSFDYARGRIAVTKTSIALNNVMVRIIPGDVTLQGNISGIGSDAPHVNLDAKVEDMPVGQVLALLKTKSDASGSISGQLHLRGSGENVSASGDVKLADGSVAGYPINSAEAAFAYADGSLKLTGLQAQSGSSVFSGEGSMDKNGTLNFDFNADNMSLAPISEKTKPYIALAGSANLKGALTGTLDEPKLQASITSEGPTINTVRFDKFGAEIAWDGTSLSVSNIALTSKNGGFEIKRAAYDSSNGTVAVDGGSLKDFSYTTLYTLGTESPYMKLADAKKMSSLLARLRKPEKGSLSAEFSASGPANDLVGKIKLGAKDIDIGQIKNVDLNMAATSRRGEITVDSLQATADPLSISAQGTLSTDGRLNLDVDAYNVDLGALTPGIGPNHISGMATARASIDGKIDAPVVTASVEMVQPVIYGIKFDGLRASQITIDSNSIDISRVQLTGQDLSAVGYGKLPWNWATFTVSPDRQMELHAKLDGQALRLLTQFTDVIVPDQEHPGNISATLDVSGTPGNPDVNGQLNLADATLGIKGLKTKFTDVKGSMSVNKDTVQIAKFTGSSSDGGQFEFSGTLPWNWSGFTVPEDRPIDLHAKLTDQSLSVISAFTDAIIPDPIRPGRASIDVAVTGAMKHPNVSGHAMISDGNLGIKGLKSRLINAQARLAFDQDRIEVDGLSALSSDGGRLDVVSNNGQPGVLFTHKVDSSTASAARPVIVQIAGLNLVEENMFGYQERVNGSLTSAENQIQISGWILEPEIKGHIDISQAAALISPVSTPPPAKTWNLAINPKFDLTLTLKDDVWFRNPMLVALMQGEGHLLGPLQNPRIDATLKIAQGYIKLPTARMTITSGTVTTNWTASSDKAHVIVDLRAQTTIASTTVTGEQKRYTIVMSVHGPLDNLQSDNIDLRSEPPGLSRSQILTALGRFDELIPSQEMAFRDQMKDIFNVAVSPLLFDPLETRFIQALGLEEFDIEYGLDQPLSVYLSRKLFGDIYMSYWRMVTGTPSITGVNYTMSLSYRLKDWLNLSYVIDSRRVGIIEASYNIRF